MWNHSGHDRGGVVALGLQGAVSLATYALLPRLLFPPGARAESQQAAADVGESAEPSIHLQNAFCVPNIPIE